MMGFSSYRMHALLHLFYKLISVWITTFLCPAQLLTHTSTAGSFTARLAPRRLVYCLPMRTLVEQTESEMRRWVGNMWKYTNDLLAKALQ